VVGDPDRLRQVLLNLAGNAVKFTARGGVWIAVGVESEGSGSILLRFSVRDTGIGIPVEKRELIFEAFRQADGSTTRKYGGTGLGLAIATQLVQMMGGKIWVDSEVGRGSTFHFTAVMRPSKNPQLKARTRRSDLGGLRALVVDDNATNRLILDEWLRGWEAEPTAVSDGLSALNALWQGVSEGRPFAVALLDSRMPGIDGRQNRTDLAGPPAKHSLCRGQEKA